MKCTCCVVQLALRDNDLIALPAEVGELSRLRELHVQNNRLTVLPPELGMYMFIQHILAVLSQAQTCCCQQCWYGTGNLDLVGSKQLLRMENNPWVPSIAGELQLGVSHVLDHIRTSTYERSVT